jgi:MSHA pilin protein MshD
MCIRGPSRQRGVTLIELVMFIVIVSASIAGVLLAINQTTRASADPLITKQALAIAEALLEEVQSKPFTFCDPNDAQAATATSATIGAAGCAATIEAIGPEAGETRTGGVGSATPFDNVNDYNIFAMNPITDITGGAVGSGGYAASVAVASAALGGIAATDANGQANVLLITVTVTGPSNVTVALQGYRAKYAPRI